MELYDSRNTTDLNRLVGACMALLQKNRLTVTTVESCTGGMLSARLVDIPGVSEMFQEGYATYSNKAKRRLLNVSKITLEKYDAVSIQTAREVTTGTVSAASADIAISITGIAGPDGGGDEKPVDLMFVGYYMNDRAAMEEHCFQEDRTVVQTQAVQSALRLLRAAILENTKA